MHECSSCSSARAQVLVVFDCSCARAGVLECSSARVLECSSAGVLVVLSSSREYAGAALLWCSYSSVRDRARVLACSCSSARVSVSARVLEYSSVRRAHVLVIKWSACSTARDRVLECSSAGVLVVLSSTCSCRPRVVIVLEYSCSCSCSCSCLCSCSCSCSSGRVRVFVLECSSACATYVIGRSKPHKFKMSAFWFFSASCCKIVSSVHYSSTVQNHTQVEQRFMFVTQRLHC